MFLSLSEGAQVPQGIITNVTDASQNFSTWRRVRTDPQTVIPLEPHGLRGNNRYEILNGNTLYLVYNPEGRKLPFQLNHSNESLNARESYPRTNFIHTLKKTVDQYHLSTLVPRNVTMLYNLTSGTEHTWDTVAPHTDLFSSYEKCKPLYSCLFFTLSNFKPQISGPHDETFMPEFRECATTKLLDFNFLVCPLVLRTDQDNGCNYQNLRLSSVFLNLTIDEDIKQFADGGPDSHGQWWPGTQIITDQNITLLPPQSFENQSNVEGIYSSFKGTWWPNRTSPFATALGQQALGDQSFQCSLASPCAPVLKCDAVGSYSPSMSRRINPTVWAYLALVSLKNINTQLSNIYIGLKGSAILATLRTFTIQEFFPQPKTFDIGDLFNAFASIFSIFGGFVPGVGEGVGVGAEAVRAVRGFLAKRAAIASPSTLREAS